MAKLRLLGRTSSINVRKVLWTLAELDVPFDHEDEWGTPARDLTSSAFKTLNPNSLVPVLEDKEVVLWESNTICRYLASTYDRQDLLPSSAAERAQVDMWMDWQATELNTAWRYAFMHLIRKDPAYADRSQVTKSVERANALMVMLDKHLESSGP